MNSKHQYLITVLALALAAALGAVALAVTAGQAPQALLVGTLAAFYTGLAGAVIHSALLGLRRRA